MNANHPPPRPCEGRRYQLSLHRAALSQYAVDEVKATVFISRSSGARQGRHHCLKSRRPSKISPGTVVHIFRSVLNRDGGAPTWPASIMTCFSRAAVSRLRLRRSSSCFIAERHDSLSEFADRYLHRRSRIPLIAHIRSFTLSQMLSSKYVALEGGLQ